MGSLETSDAAPEELRRAYRRIVVEGVFRQVVDDLTALYADTPEREHGLDALAFLHSPVFQHLCSLLGVRPFVIRRELVRRAKRKSLRTGSVSENVYE